jgi:hypothetical protein
MPIVKSESTNKIERGVNFNDAIAEDVLKEE